MLWLALPAPGGNIIPEWQSLRSLLGATNPCGTAKAYKRRALRVAEKLRAGECPRDAI